MWHSGRQHPLSTHILFSPNKNDNYTSAIKLGVCPLKFFRAIHCVAWYFHFVTLCEWWVWRPLHFKLAHFYDIFSVLFALSAKGILKLFGVRWDFSSAFYWALSGQFSSFISLHEWFFLYSLSLHSMLLHWVHMLRLTGSASSLIYESYHITSSNFRVLGYEQGCLGGTCRVWMGSMF